MQGSSSCQQNLEAKTNTEYWDQGFKKTLDARWTLAYGLEFFVIKRRLNVFCD